MENIDILYNVLFVGFILTIFVTGWFSNELYRIESNKRMYNGLRIGGDVNYTVVKEITTKYDKNGDWICVNVNGMTPQEMIETCQHEAGHEIFAEYCEDNWEECLEVTK